MHCQRADLSKPIFVGGKRISSRVHSTPKDRQAVKNIADPFLRWYNELFNSEDYFKKLEDDSQYVKVSLDKGDGFEVNEETLFNILSADVQGSSKMQSFHTLHVLPTIPASIAERTNLQKETYSYKLNKCCKERDDKRGIVRRIKYTDRVQDIDVNTYLTSNDFIDTRNMCESFKNLTIMKNFFANSEEYLAYKDSKSS